jgi:phage terminase large subunit GpA-like protein
MDAVSDPRVETVVIMSSAQVGKTEIGLNLVGFHVHQDPAPILVLLPTVEMGEAWSKDRLATMLRDSPELRGRVGGGKAKAKSGGDTLRHKTFPGGHLTIAGANSPSSLASRPIRVLVCDEVDRFPPSAGSEGDPVSLGRKRTTTFWNRKVVLVSTPTIAGKSRIEAAYQDSDRRRYWVPCPHCGECQPLDWERVQWTGDDARTAAYHCAECGGAWTDAQRWKAIREATKRGGGWRAEGEFRGVAGFQLSELYSTWRRLEETVADFLSARGHVEQMKAWRNTALGLPWRESGEAPDWERLVERREAFPLGVVPRRASVVTAGVDVQGDRLECFAWAWARGLESWAIDRRIFYGDPATAAPWLELRAYLDRDFPREGGGTMRVAKIGVDTGGTATAAVYGHLRAWRDPRVVPMKGADGWNRSAPVAGPTQVDVTIGGRKLRRGLRLWTVAVSTWKAELYRRLWTGRGEEETFPAGWVHLSAGLDVEAVKQLVAEELVSVKDRRGFLRQEWRKLRERNEALDCAVYARAALYVLGADRYGPRFWQEAELALERDEINSTGGTATPPGDAPPPAVSPGDGGGADNDDDPPPEVPPPAPPAAPPSAPRPRAGWINRRGRGWIR